MKRALRTNIIHEAINSLLSCPYAYVQKIPLSCQIYDEKGGKNRVYLSKCSLRLFNRTINQANGVVAEEIVLRLNLGVQ